MPGTPATACSRRPATRIWKKGDEAAAQASSRLPAIAERLYGATFSAIRKAAGDAAPEFPRDDIESLRKQISHPEQFVINFNYLARRVQRKG